eukprot:TRINITY_DN27267_c0_g1_i1.p1 TRINITY_DN27267_c0_g1~~TRINITY_DN27267_c0_g1_i1.p1  ORF type:complete len:128 (+),score=4.43 TRINITY_DN27267_c0_g1_i1:133-516(+)
MFFSAGSRPFAVGSDILQRDHIFCSTIRSFAVNHNTAIEDTRKRRHALRRNTDHPFVVGSDLAVGSRAFAAGSMVEPQQAWTTFGNTYELVEFGYNPYSVGSDLCGGISIFCSRVRHFVPGSTPFAI